MRKNLKTGEYEIYRQYGHTIVRAWRNEHIRTVLVTDEGTEKMEIAFHDKDILKAIAFAAGEVAKFWHHENDDELCTHERPKISILCPNYR